MLVRSSARALACWRKAALATSTPLRYELCISSRSFATVPGASSRSPPISQVPTLSGSRARLREWLRQSEAKNATGSHSSVPLCGATLVEMVAAVSMETSDEGLEHLLCALSANLQAGYNQAGMPDAADVLYEDVIAGNVSADSLQFTVLTLGGAIDRYAEVHPAAPGAATSPQTESQSNPTGNDVDGGGGVALNSAQLAEIRLTLQGVRAWMDAHTAHSITKAAYHVGEVHKGGSDEALAPDRQAYWVAYSQRLTRVMYPLLAQDAASREGGSNKDDEATRRQFENTFKETLRTVYGEGGAAPGRLGLQNQWHYMRTVLVPYLRDGISSALAVAQATAQSPESPAGSAQASASEKNRGNKPAGGGSPSLGTAPQLDAAAEKARLRRTGAGVCIIVVLALLLSHNQKLQEEKQSEKASSSTNPILGVSHTAVRNLQSAFDSNDK